MGNTVDLTNLRTITEGEKELEMALFQEFYSSSEEMLETLAANCGDNQSETWRTTVHALKGTALNIGAENLGALCKQGQDDFKASTEHKQELLARIKLEYAAAKTYLQAVHAQ